MAKGKSTKKRKVHVESEGMAFIQASFNNVIISITNKQGQVISWSSAGKANSRRVSRTNSVEAWHLSPHPESF